MLNLNQELEVETLEGEQLQANYLINPKINESNFTMKEKFNNSNNKNNKIHARFLLIKDGKKKLIYTKDSSGSWNKIMVFNYSLIYYPDANNLPQTSDRNYRLNKEALVETYSI